MGESVAEATLTAWLKEVGDEIQVDDSVLEVATDKVDSDVPSEVAGILVEKRFQIDDVIQVGDVIAVIETEGEINEEEETLSEVNVEEVLLPKEIVEVVETPVFERKEPASLSTKTTNDRAYFSPLVRSIAEKEGVSQQELENIKGSGENQRITKKDLFKYLENRLDNPAPAEAKPLSSNQNIIPTTSATSSEDQVIEMSRMAKLISSHMTESKNTAVHVQSFVEADVTDLWEWREKVKNDFFAREGEKFTFTPIFISAIIHALKNFPLLNSSLNGDQIIQKKNINIGMATALSDGNLIVPVIKNADHLNLVGLAKAVNDLSTRARNNQLKPEEVQGGTYTVTNIGNFGSITGTPIINQPQVGILALGVIRKMPAVIETPEGDFVGIRRKMILSHSYDHRLVNGAMGGQFAKAVADYLAKWDTNINF